VRDLNKGVCDAEKDTEVLVAFDRRKPEEGR